MARISGHPVCLVASSLKPQVCVFAVHVDVAEEKDYALHRRNAEVRGTQSKRNQAGRVLLAVRKVLENQRSDVPERVWRQITRRPRRHQDPIETAT